MFYISSKVAVSQKESDIRILNEPLDSSSKVSSVFVVETGESRTRPETTIDYFIFSNWSRADFKQAALAGN